MLDNLSLWHITIVLLALVPFMLSIWAIILTARDGGVSTVVTVLWAAIMLLFYGVGLIVWFVWWIARKRSGTPHNA